MKEKQTDAYTTISPDRLPNEINKDLAEELIKEGFNHFTQKQMLLYTRIMEESTEKNIEYKEPGKFKKVKDTYLSNKLPVKSGFARIHEFIVSASRITGVSMHEMTVHMVRHGVMNLDGKGCSDEEEYEQLQEKAANFDNTLRESLNVKARADTVEPVDEEEVRKNR